MQPDLIYILNIAIVQMFMLFYIRIMKTVVQCISMYNTVRRWGGGPSCHKVLESFNYLKQISLQTMFFNISKNTKKLRCVLRYFLLC